jgi:hypothetical protein
LAPTLPWFSFVASSINKVYRTHLHTLEGQRKKIHSKISTISGEELQTVNNSTFHSCTLCIQPGGQHLQNLLSFVRLSKVYKRGESFSCFLHRMFNLPRFGVWCNTSRVSGGHLSVKQDTKHPIHTIILTFQDKTNISFLINFSFQTDIFQNYRIFTEINMHIGKVGTNFPSCSLFS